MLSATAAGVGEPTAPSTLALITIAIHALSRPTIRCTTPDATASAGPRPVNGRLRGVTDQLIVRRLSTTPVKGLVLHHPDSIALAEYGAVGDRRFMLVDEAGKLQSCTHNAALFGLHAVWDEQARHLAVSRDGAVLVSGTIEPAEQRPMDMFGLRTIETEVVADPVWEEFFSTLLDKRVRLRQARDTAVDVRPVTLLGRSSLEELSRRAGVPDLDAQRFRMLIEFSGGEPHAEDSWNGRLLRIGAAVIRAEGPVKRCAATTRNPATGEVDLPTLKMITAYRGRQENLLGVGAMFGIYGDVVEPGTVAVGDPLEVLDRL